MKTKKLMVYIQNNSGGSFDSTKEYYVETKVFPLKDSFMSNYGYIHLGFTKDMLDKVTAYGIYFDGVDNGVDCECCGNRWDSHPIENKVLIFETNEEYEEYTETTDDDTFSIYYMIEGDFQ